MGDSGAGEVSTPQLLPLGGVCVAQLLAVFQFGQKVTPLDLTEAYT